MNAEQRGHWQQHVWVEAADATSAIEAARVIARDRGWTIVTVVRARRYDPGWVVRLTLQR